MLFTLYFLILEKKLEIHHDIFQVVAEWYDTSFNPVFYVEKFLRKVGSKWAHQASVEPVGMQLFKVRKTDIFKVCNDHIQKGNLWTYASYTGKPWQVHWVYVFWKVLDMHYHWMHFVCRLDHEEVVLLKGTGFLLFRHRKKLKEEVSLANGCFKYNCYSVPRSKCLLYRLQVKEVCNVTLI